MNGELKYFFSRGKSNILNVIFLVLIKDSIELQNMNQIIWRPSMTDNFFHSTFSYEVTGNITM